jgi:hypothetical protein
MCSIDDITAVSIVTTQRCDRGSPDAQHAVLLQRLAGTRVKGNASSLVSFAGPNGDHANLLSKSNIFHP